MPLQVEDLERHWRHFWKKIPGSLGPLFRKWGSCSPISYTLQSFAWWPTPPPHFRYRPIRYQNERSCRGIFGTGASLCWPWPSIFFCLRDLETVVHSCCSFCSSCCCHYASVASSVAFALTSAATVVFATVRTQLILCFPVTTECSCT